MGVCVCVCDAIAPNTLLPIAKCILYSLGISVEINKLVSILTAKHEKM